MAIDYAHEIKLGEILKATPRAIGAAGGGKRKGLRGSLVSPRNNTPTIADLGLDKKTSMKAKRLRGRLAWAALK